MVINVNKGKWGWGLALIVVAALILANHFGGFVDLGVWTIVVASLVVIVLIQSIATFNFGMIPIALAALYWIFQTPLELPEIGFWQLALVAILVSAGLTAIIPKKRLKKKRWNIGSGGSRIVYDKRGNRIDFDDDDDDVVIDVDYDDADDEANGVNVKIGPRPKKKVHESGGDNNPSISVSLGAVTRYLRADALETVELNCSMGNLEVYFDDVTLSPNGAVADVSCSLGNMELYLPREWRVIDNLGASLGNAEVDHRFNDDEDAPTITINGSVSLGNIEICRIKR